MEENEDITKKVITSTDLALSSSNRFRPTERLVFDKPIKGPNGADLIAYEWVYELIEEPAKEGDHIVKRISDWDKAISSADTGRGIVHQFEIRLSHGQIKLVSSESVLILLGYTERQSLKVFPSLVNAVKTLAKQKLQLQIQIAQQKEYDEAKTRVLSGKKPPIIEKEYKARVDGGTTIYGMGDATVWQNDSSEYNEEKGNSVYFKLNYIDDERKTVLEDSWLKSELKKLGVKKSYAVRDLQERISRQERKVNQLTKEATSEEIIPVIEKNAYEKDLELYERDIKTKQKYIDKYESQLNSAILPHQRPAIEKNLASVTKRHKQALEDLEQYKNMQEGKVLIEEPIKMENKIIFYQVKIGYDTWDIEKYYGIYKSKALSEFNSLTIYDVDDKYQDYKGLSAIIDEKTNEYDFIYELDIDETIEDFPIGEYYDNENIYKINSEGNWENLDIKTLAPINKKSDEVLSEVQSHYGGKYSTINLDEEGNHQLKLRIADHSGKHKNKGYEDYFLSIVIAEKNATKHFKTQGPEGLRSNEEFEFDSETNAKEIIEFIDEKIVEFKEEVIEQHKKNINIKSCLLSDGDNENDYIVEGTKIHSTTGDKKVTYEVLEFEKDGIILKHVPESILDDARSNKHVTYHELTEMFERGKIAIDNINSVQSIIHCIKAIKSCFDKMDVVIYKEDVEKRLQEAEARIAELTKPVSKPVISHDPDFVAEDISGQEYKDALEGAETALEFTEDEMEKQNLQDYIDGLKIAIEDMEM